MPLPAAAAVNDWATDWCDPVPCTPGTLYGEGMPKADFKALAAKSCGTIYQDAFDAPQLISPTSGYSYPPMGFWVQGSAMEDLRWSAGEPVWCTDTSMLVIPFRYFRFDPTAAWGLTSGSWQLGSRAETKLTLRCLDNAGVKQQASETGSSVQSGMGGNNALSRWPEGAAPVTSDGTKSFVSTPFFIPQGTTPLRSLLSSATRCVTILSLEMEIPTDTIGGLAKIEWTGARALNGQPNVWSDLETLDCSDPKIQPVECIGQNVAPHTVACKKLTIDPTTWSHLGPCVFGTPQDYITGIGFLDQELDMPLPGTGSCSPWTVGTMPDGSPFTLDLCGWYPAVRPTIDVIMTAGLWIAVVASVFRTRAGTTE